MRTIKLSFRGLSEVHRQLDERGWNRYSDRVCIKASEIREPKKEWEEGGPYTYGCSRNTWEKFLARKLIKEEAFNLYCEVLGLDPAEVAHKIKTDWGQAPDPETFHGREEDLIKLTKWIVDERCRLTSIFGFAGIGKTALARELADRFEEEEEFEYIIWRKLYDTLPLESLLKELIEIVSDDRETELASTIEGLTEQLLRYLKERRCLLIFDEIESILGSENSIGSDREEYKGFFHCIGTSKHSSCLLLTSRIRFSSLERTEIISDAVGWLELKELDTEAGREICQDTVRKLDGEIQGTEEEWKHSIDNYNGNPLALQFVARHILRIHGGNLAKFLKEDLKILKDIKQLFNWHFELLISDEQTIMYWLALSREGRSIDELREYLVFDREKKFLPQTLDSLEKKIPIEKSGDCWILHSLLMEYTTEQAIEKVCAELTSGNLELFNSVALIQASAKDYIKDEQIRLILQPIIERLQESFGSESQNSLENRLTPPQLLKNFNRTFPGYTAGNLINLMHYVGIDLSHRDFSRMTIREADLNTNLHNVNFADCKFSRCSLIKNFNWVSAIAFDPRKELIAVADDFGDIRLLSFDGQTNLILSSKNRTLVQDLAFSPDGKFIASYSLVTVNIWDIATEKLYQTFTREQQKFTFSAFAFSPDGQTFATGGYSHDLKADIINLWNIHTNECRALQPKNRLHIKSLIFHSQENLLACTGYNTVCMWDTATEKLLYTLDEFKGHVVVDFHPTDRVLVIGCSDGTIKTLDAETGEELKTWQGHGHKEQVFSVSFSRDGQKIVSIGDDGKLKVWVWGAETEECLKTLSIDLRSSQIIEFSPQKNILAIYNEHRMLLELLNIDTEKYFKIWQSHSNIMEKIAISPDAQTVASCSANKTIRVWVNGKISTWKLDRRADKLLFSPDAQTIVTWTWDGIIELRSTKTGKHYKTLEHYSSTRIGILQIQYSPDGKLLASYDLVAGRIVNIWDVKTGEHLRSIEAGINYERIDFDCSWDAKTGRKNLGFISVNHGNGGIWFNLGCDVTAGKHLRSITRGDNYYDGNVAFDYGGQYLATINAVFKTWNTFNDRRSTYTSTEVEIWNLETGELDRRFDCSANRGANVAFHPNERVLVGWNGKLIIFWNLQTGESKSIQAFEDPTKRFRHLFFDEEGNILIASSIDSTIEIWQIDTAEIWSADTAARRIRVLEDHRSSIIRVETTPDGRKLVSCDESGVILRWNLETQQTSELISSKRRYEGMIISGIEGLTNAQINTSKAFGAVD